MPYPVYYHGLISISPRLTEDDAELFSSLGAYQSNERADAILARMQSVSKAMVTSYAGMLSLGRMHASLSAGTDESSHGVGPWLQLLIDHFFAPRGYVLHGKISWIASEDGKDRGSIFVKDNRIEAVDDLILNPGPSWEPTPFADVLLKQILRELIDSADPTGCSSDLTVVSSTAVEALRERSTRF